MRIACISDMHGQLVRITEKVDLLLISGDICPHFSRPGSVGDVFDQSKWLGNEFADWLSKVPAKEVISTPGNHDWCFLKKPDLIPNLPWHLLIDKSKEVLEVKCYGSPWQNFFHDWAYNAPPGEEGEVFLEKKYRNIPNDTQIIVSHGPPYGYGDLTIAHERTGSRALLNRIMEIQPKLVCCGHLHGSYCVTEYKLGKFICNATVLDEQYKLVKGPIYLDLDL